MEADLPALTEMRERPAGTIRTLYGDHVAIGILPPALKQLLPNYLDIKAAVIVDNGFTDIVTDCFDAGVRLEEAVENDMIATRIVPEMRRVVVGSPSSPMGRGTPPTRQDLTETTPASTSDWRATAVTTDGCSRRRARR